MLTLLAFLLALTPTGTNPADPGAASVPAHDERPAGIAWKSWSDSVFEEAAKEKKLVLLDLQAVWCHWCHVMERTTYADARVREYLREHFVAVQVDQDSRPDLANRYEDYGWPATIVFDASARELALRSGYIAPDAMLAMLRAFVADPTPGPSVRPDPRAAARAGEMTDELRTELEDAQIARYDRLHAGFGSVHKFLDAASIEWAIGRALDGDAAAETMARATLDAATALIDPVWGGIYQYSVGPGWREPHFEKIQSYQADALRGYSLGFAAFRDPRYLRAARDVRRYLGTFLTSPEGAFYASQDADLVPGEHSGEYFELSDAARRARGVPRVDTHVYARENGWIIGALCAMHAATGDEFALADARRAAEWILGERALEGGGFRHDENDAAGPYLGDTLSMGTALLALYEVTAERVWLHRAEAASDFIARTFARGDQSGFVTSRGGSEPFESLPQRDENVALVRFESALAGYGGRDVHGDRARSALRWLTIPAIAERGLPAGVLLADEAARRDALHVTVVGSKSDPAARALFTAALGMPAIFRRIEWYDAAEGPAPNADVEYPALDAAAAFLCVDGRCSKPARTPDELAQRIAAARPGQ
jgi:uncharacterized protein YyaL (SSP411 family)